MNMFMDQVSVIFDRLKKDKQFSLIIKGLILFIIIGIGLFIFSKVKGVITKNSHEDPLIEEDGKYKGEPIEGILPEEAETGSYYIMHNDILYPLQIWYSSNYELDTRDYEELEGSSSDHLQAMLSEDFDNIPTLYLSNGDKLVYYDENEIMECVRIERFKDEGNSVGIFNLEPNTYNKYYTINLEQEEKDVETHSIYPDSKASELLSGILDQSEESNRRKKKNPDLTYLTITKIGDKELTKDQISSTGIIKGLTRDNEYSLSIYNGTVYNDYILPADTHYFTGLEAYATTDIVLSEDSLQEINLPKGLLDGYYVVDDFGFFRISNKDTWKDDAEHFNKRLLESYEEKVDTEYMDSDEAAYIEDLPAVIYTNLYSEDERINQYYPINSSSFGYKKIKDNSYQEDKEEVEINPDEKDKSETIEATETEETDKENVKDIEEEITDDEETIEEDKESEGTETSEEVSEEKDKKK